MKITFMYIAEQTFMLHTCDIVKAGSVEFAHVELQANDGKHKDGHK